MVLHCDINGMEEVDLYIHHGGTCVLEPRLSYEGGKVLKVEDFEIDYLDITSTTTKIIYGVIFKIMTPYNLIFRKMTYHIKNI